MAQDGANLCLVLEFCEGRTLRDVQDFCGGRFTEQEAKFYAAEVLAALEFVHAMGFVYRDLKPQNVLVQRDGHIRLADFGVAQCGDAGWDALDTDDTQQQQHCQRDANDRIRLRSNSFVGTADYMSPEMILQQPQSSDMDWWAFGCLLYEVLYGVGPFQSASEAAIDPVSQFRAILECRVSFPATPKVSTECKDLLRALLTKDPTARLGHCRGARDVKRHPFFSGVQWALLGHRVPPVTVATPAVAVHSLGSPLCLRIVGSELVDDIAAIEARTLGEFASGEWTGRRLDPCCECGLEEDELEARSPQTLSVYSTGDDTCDEEFDPVVLTPDSPFAATTETSRRRRTGINVTETLYQRCYRFDRQLPRTPSLFETIRNRRTGVRHAPPRKLAVAHSVASPRPTGDHPSAPSSRTGSGVFARSAWTKFVSRAASAHV